jgi:hypothetical protein
LASARDAQCVNHVDFAGGVKVAAITLAEAVPASD